jgi:glycogen operon protein
MQNVSFPVEAGSAHPLGSEFLTRYRDDVRRFVKGDAGVVGAIASRLGGSSDIYQERGGTPLNSINFVLS